MALGRNELRAEFDNTKFEERIIDEPGSNHIVTSNEYCSNCNMYCNPGIKSIFDFYYITFYNQ